MQTETVNFPAGTLEALQRMAPQMVLPGAPLGVCAELLARINAGQLECTTEQEKD